MTDPIARTCPTCGARPGDECLTVAGLGMGHLTHAQRRTLTRQRRRSIDRRIFQSPRKDRRRNP